VAAWRARKGWCRVADRMLGELYMDARSHLVQVGGHQVVGSVRLQLSTPCALSVDATFAHADPQQGVVLDAKPRQLEVAGQRGKSLVLWEYAPFPVDALYVARKGPFVVMIYNVWKGPYDATMAWIANGGMVIGEFTEECLILDCNAGPREVTFADARLTVTWPADVAVRLLLPGDEPVAPA
jgi:hypothetical protein